MPRVAKELYPLQIRRLSKPGTYNVGGVNGLLLKVSASGSKSWILRYSTGELRESKSGRQFYARRDHGLGSYPTVGLSQARQRAYLRRTC